MRLYVSCMPSWRKLPKSTCTQRAPISKKRYEAARKLEKLAEAETTIWP